jgi:ParB/RepB/Spo0J family partition protein
MAKTKLTKQELPKWLLMDIDLNIIVPSKTNPRKEFKEDALNDLAASIKSVGLMQPLVLHKAAEEYKYGLISGERRFRAAKIAGLTSIPCMCYDKLSDEIVLEMQITENLQRQDINPMEESDAFQQLITMGMATAEVIADKLGKSTKYVYDRIILQKVVPEVQDAIREGKLTITHGKQFARLPFFEQAKIIEHFDIEEGTVADLRYAISRTFNLKLDKAVFDITSKSLVKKAGACTSCSKRSGCNLVLFEDIKDDDICFDAECWNNKAEANIEFIIEKLKGEGKEVVKISTEYQTKFPDVLAMSDWDESYADQEEGEVELSNLYGVIVELGKYTTGYQLGQVIHLNDDREEEVQDKTPNSNSPQRMTNTQYVPRVNHAITFSKLVIEQTFTKGVYAQSIFKFICKLFVNVITRFDEDHLEWFLKLIDWDLIPVDVNDHEEYFLNIMEEKFTAIDLSKVAKLLYLADLVDDYVDGYISMDDYEFIKDFQDKVPGIDFEAIISQVNKSVGEEVLTLPLEETQS